MNTPSPTDAATLPEPRTYVPGYAGWKLLLSVCGAILFCVGFMQLWPPLRLVLFGERAQAVATRIVETRPGVADVIVDGGTAAVAVYGSHDKDAVFWNEFTFQTAAGRTVETRDQVGSRSTPLYPLIDSEGLPTTKLVCYDRQHPEVCTFPGEFSTWLVPLGLTLAGLATATISAVLLYWAGKPIELPDIQVSDRARLP